MMSTTTEFASTAEKTSQTTWWLRRKTPAMLGRIGSRLTPRPATCRDKPMTHPLQSASKINAPGTLAAPSGSDVRPETGQLSCPKGRALTVNVNASDIIRDNGYVTCSNCGHERQIRKLTGLE